MTPPDFAADVERARDGRRPGDLRLYAFECRELSWAPEGLRTAGRALLDLEAWSGAREAFEWLRELRPEDGEANQQLAELRARQADPDAAGPVRTLLFTGHMLDAPDRKDPRFPPAASAEAEARRMIQEAVTAERAEQRGLMAAIAGGACGGDILFHEVCLEHGIEAQLYLALPPGDFIDASVRHGGPRWIDRFTQLITKLPVRVLAEGTELPLWVSRDTYSIWQRNNLWMLFNALALDAPKLTLIALWDRGPADGPGGTADLVAQVESRGHTVRRLAGEGLKALEP